MKMDKRRMKLWGMLVFSTMFTTYQLVFNRPATRGVPGAAPAQGEPPPAAAAAPAAAPVPAAAVPGAPVVPLAADDLTLWRAGMPEAQRDPFFTAAELEAMGRPQLEAPVAVAAPAALPEYVLKLVLMEGTEGRALIDGQVVQVGDRVGEERVAQILPDAVVLERERGGTRRRLELAGSKPVQITLERTR